MSKVSPKNFAPVTIAAAIKAAILFGAAGTLHWWQAWAFVGLDLVFSFIAVFYLYQNKEELLEERKTAAKKAKPWDKKIVPLVIIVLPFAMLVLAGLDLRLGWTRGLGWPINALGLLLLALGNAAFFWAHFTNQFFSSFARIQSERGHQVISTGPYQYVRHPGYVGLIVGSLALPLLLGSLAALAAGLLTALLYVLRTALEDRMLLDELEGYKGYAAKVKYRLLPGVW